MDDLDDRITTASQTYEKAATAAEQAKNASLELADADSDTLAVGAQVGLSFRRFYTAGGVHNYFWKARPLAETETPEGSTA